jgi:hypothetical protein
MLSIIYSGLFALSVVMLSVVMLGVVMLNVVMLSVIAQDKHSSLFDRRRETFFTSLPQIV